MLGWSRNEKIDELIKNNYVSDGSGLSLSNINMWSVISRVLFYDMSNTVLILWLLILSRIDTWTLYSCLKCYV